MRTRLHTDGLVAVILLIAAVAFALGVLIGRVVTGRRSAVMLAVTLLVVVVSLLVVETARGGEPPVVTAIRAEFGAGPLAGCFTAIAYRESRYNARAANWTDRHSDGSRGSFGAFQIGALWRNPGESVQQFAQRMYRPAEAAKLAHRIWRRHGTAPWGGC